MIQPSTRPSAPTTLENSAPTTLENSAPTTLEIGATDVMTCAACVGRIERALKKVDGVLEASVNLATERAAVQFTEYQVSIGLLERAIRDVENGILETAAGQTREDAQTIANVSS